MQRKVITPSGFVIQKKFIILSLMNRKEEIQICFTLVLLKSLCFKDYGSKNFNIKALQHFSEALVLL
jgi:hypothetical protein